MRVFLRRLRLDPLTFIICFATWSMICGLSLALPGEAWSYNPAWATLQAFRVPDTAWGLLMIADAILLFLAIRITDTSYRAAICIVTGVTWALLGISILVTSFQQFGHLSAVGAFSTVGAILCLVAAEKWVAFNEH
jgi:hypothetical protein